MKNLVLPVLLFAATFSFAQTDTPVVENKVFQLVEQMPEYPGGEAALLQFVQKNVRYPDVERENDIQGRVVVGFIVNEDGSLSDVMIKKGVSKGIDKEALRVVNMLPKFKPGKAQGKPVRVQFVLPIMFKLSAPEPPKKR
jgi:protein TonB